MRLEDTARLELKIDELREELEKIQVLNTDDFINGFDIIVKNLEKEMNDTFRTINNGRGMDVDHSFINGQTSVISRLKKYPENILYNKQVEFERMISDISKKLTSKKELEMWAEEK